MLSNFSLFLRFLFAFHCNFYFLNGMLAPIVVNFSSLRQYYYMYIKSKIINQKKDQCEHVTNIIKNQLIESIGNTNLIFSLDKNEKIYVAFDMEQAEKFIDIIHELGHLNGSIYGINNVIDAHKKEVLLNIYKNFNYGTAATIYNGVSQLPKNTIKMLFNGKVTEFLMNEAFYAYFREKDNIGIVITNQLREGIVNCCFVEKGDIFYYGSDFFKAKQLIKAYNLSDSAVRKIIDDSVQSINRYLPVSVLYAYCIYHLAYNIPQKSFDYIKTKKKELGLDDVINLQNETHIKLKLDTFNPFIENKEQKKILVDVCKKLIIFNTQQDTQQEVCPRLRVATKLAKSALQNIDK